jgi:hypothetical protein
MYLKACRLLKEYSVNTAYISSTLGTTASHRQLLTSGVKPFLGMYSVVGVATGYGLDDRGIGVRVLVVSRIFSSPRHPGRLWGPPNFVSNRYRGLFPRR